MWLIWANLTLLHSTGEGASQPIVQGPDQHAYALTGIYEILRCDGASYEKIVEAVCSIRHKARIDYLVFALAQRLAVVGLFMAACSWEREEKKGGFSNL